MASKKMLSVADMATQSGKTEQEVRSTIALVKRAMLSEGKQIHVKEGGRDHMYTVERRGVGVLTLDEGPLWQYDFLIDDTWAKYSVIVKADIDPERLVPVFSSPERLVLRIDSGCETGQLFRDKTCECREQLHKAIGSLYAAGEGMIICIPRQDGRGMGLSFKLGTLWLQHELGLDTVQSANLLTEGAEIDIRTYSGVIGVLKFFGIPKDCQIELATNNPRKAKVFEENGYTLEKITPVVIPANHHTAKHLRAKCAHLGHTHLDNGEE